MTNPFHEPAESGDSDDSVWEDLVRRLEADPADPSTPGSGAQEGAGTPGPRDSSGTSAQRPVDPQLFRMHPALSGPRDYESAEDEGDGEFIPDDPPAIGSGNPLLNLAWVCAAGAPIALLLLAIFWRRAPMPLWVGLVGLAVAAAVFLFARLPRDRHDGDDGARV